MASISHNRSLELLCKPDSVQETCETNSDSCPKRTAHSKTTLNFLCTAIFVSPRRSLIYPGCFACPRISVATCLVVACSMLMEMIVIAQTSLDSPRNLAV